MQQSSHASTRDMGTPPRGIVPIGIQFSPGPEFLDASINGPQPQRKTIRKAPIIKPIHQDDCVVNFRLDFDGALKHESILSKCPNGFSSSPTICGTSFSNLSIFQGNNGMEMSDPKFRHSPASEACDDEYGHLRTRIEDLAASFDADTNITPLGDLLDSKPSLDMDLLHGKLNFEHTDAEWTRLISPTTSLETVEMYHNSQSWQSSARPLDSIATTSMTSVDWNMAYETKHSIDNKGQASCPQFSISPPTSPKQRKCAPTTHFGLKWEKDLANESVRDARVSIDLGNDLHRELAESILSQGSTLSINAKSFQMGKVPKPRYGPSAPSSSSSISVATGSSEHGYYHQHDHSSHTGVSMTRSQQHSIHDVAAPFVTRSVAATAVARPPLHGRLESNSRVPSSKAAVSCYSGSIESDVGVIKQPSLVPRRKTNKIPSSSDQSCVHDAGPGQSLPPPPTLTISPHQVISKHSGHLTTTKSSAPNVSTTLSSDTSTVTALVPAAADSRSELVESPDSKNIGKEFYKILRLKERVSVDLAEEFAVSEASTAPDKLKWKIYLELADLAKRKNNFELARNYYSRATFLQPLACQGWLESSKMEEECGDFEAALKILELGLKHCPFNEGLLTKSVKHLEKKFNFRKAREMFQKTLRIEDIDKDWRSWMEGALFEARTGNIQAARMCFKLLMQNIPWYGPIYYEACKLEEKDGHFQGALHIVKKGLRTLPRYGPLWFNMMKLREREDSSADTYNWFTGQQPALCHLRGEVSLAVHQISRELVWKVHFEMSQAEERAVDVASVGLFNSSSASTISSARNKLLSQARQDLVRSLLACPANLRWKVWLVGSRLELSAGSIAKSRQLICKAFEEAPVKSKSNVYIEAARVEEFSGNVDCARRILETARLIVADDWKVFLEAVLLEARAGHLHTAMRLAETALEMHPATGRLWAMLIQLSHRLENVTPSHMKEPIIPNSTLAIEYPTQAAMAQANEGGDNIENNENEEATVSSDGEEVKEIFKDKPGLLKHKKVILGEALQVVPKSGEVWCEGARCALNPLHVGSFNLAIAQLYLGFAIQFTPQYGDSFVESLRLEMIIQVILPKILEVMGISLWSFVATFLCKDDETDTNEILNNSFHRLQDTISGVVFNRAERINLIQKIETMDDDLMPAKQLLAALQKVNKTNLWRRCANADPNYGSSWFHCRHSPLDSPAVALQASEQILCHEMMSCHRIYARACLRYVCVCLRSELAVNLSMTAYHLEHAGSLCATDHRMGGIADAPTARLYRHPYHTNESDENNPFRKQEQVQLEALSTVMEATNKLHNWPLATSCAPIPSITVDGNVFVSTDFVTALLGQNRQILSRYLTTEERRKILFGSDQIFP